MKLYYSPTSPFVRKVHIAAIELGLIDNIDLITDRPYDETSTVRERNPLGKIPTLITDDGSTLFDSHVICEYLDAFVPTPQLFPTTARRWSALRHQALADGVMEATLLRRLETLRPFNQQSVAWIERQSAAIVRSLSVLEAEAHTLAYAFDIGAISVVCALGYLDLRYRDLTWRAHHPRLSDWFADVAKRPSITKTSPPRVRADTLR